MSAPVGTLRPNPQKMIEDIEGMMEAFKRIREIADNQDLDAEYACGEIFAIADEILWPS